MQLAPQNPLFSRSQKVVVLADDARWASGLISKLLGGREDAENLVQGHQTHCDFGAGRRLKLQLWTCSASNRWLCPLILSHSPLVFICFPHGDATARANALEQWVPLVSAKSPGSRVILLETDTTCTGPHPRPLPLLSSPMSSSSSLQHSLVSVPSLALGESLSVCVDCLDRTQVFSWLWALTCPSNEDAQSLLAASSRPILVAAA